MSIGSNEWLALALDEKVCGEIEKDSLLPLYGSVIQQFADWNPVKWDNAVVALHIVYGWMPTVPDFERPKNLSVDKRERTTQLLNEARIRILNATEIDELKENLVNNSVVGTSKLLHLLAPNKYAIWDGRVARVWYAPEPSPRSRYEKSVEYLKYISSLKTWLIEKQVSEQISIIRKSSLYLETVSDLRILELILFHAHF
jgi:hypothetical protein